MLYRRNGEEGESEEDPEEQVSFLKTTSPRPRRKRMEQQRQVEGGTKILEGGTRILEEGTAMVKRFSEPCIEKSKTIIMNRVTTKKAQMALAGMALLSAFVLLVSISTKSSLPSGVTPKEQAEFSCPPVNYLDTGDHESGEDFEKWYGSKSRNITTDRKEFLQTFRTQHFDGWGRSYEEIKKQLGPLIAKYMAPHLKPGAKLYESASGIGLNLLLTLEVLQEMPDVNIGTGITVYGNEYVPESAQVSEMVLGDGILPPGNHRGVVCAADSTNLAHVPSNYFDVVYSGYITPLDDPIGLTDPQYDEICDGLSAPVGKEDWKLMKLWELQMRKQRDWFGQWIGEMARIAKPGAPVIAESVSYSYCTNKQDWDGVEEDFWREVATSNEYGWDIDPESIEIVPETRLFQKRYHVFMRKKAK